MAKLPLFLDKITKLHTISEISQIIITKIN